jgi:hypothetical protein
MFPFCIYYARMVSAARRGLPLAAPGRISHNKQQEAEQAGHTLE